MKKTWFSISALGVALSVVAVAPARAAVFSSSVDFAENCPVCALNGGGTAVDLLEAFIENPAGVTFQTPGLTVNLGGWSENDVLPSYSNASGPESAGFTYFLNLNIDDTTLPAGATIGVDVYYFQLISGVETLIDQAGLTYDTSLYPLQFNVDVNNWGVTDVLNPNGLAGETTTPEPSTLFLIGGGVLALGGKTLKRKLSR